MSTRCRVLDQSARLKEVLTDKWAFVTNFGFENSIAFSHCHHCGACLAWSLHFLLLFKSL